MALSKLFGNQSKAIPSPTTVLTDLLIFKITALPVNSSDHERADYSSTVFIPVRDGRIKIKIGGARPKPPHTYGGKRSFEIGMISNQEYRKVELSKADQERLMTAITQLRDREDAMLAADTISANQHLALDMIERMF